MIYHSPAFLIDCDGTLCDTLPLWRTLAADDLRARGIEPDADLNETIAAWTMRQAASYLIKRHHLPLHEEALIDAWLKRVDAGYRTAATVTAKPGALGALQFLRAHHMPAFAVTLSPRSLVEPLLRRTGLLAGLQGVFSGHELHLGKEDPGLFLLAAKHAQRDASQCIVVEDSLFALRTAAEAGFQTVAFYDPHHGSPHWQAMVAIADLAVDNWHQFTYRMASKNSHSI